jgi:hypothetical protein
VGVLTILFVFSLVVQRPFGGLDIAPQAQIYLVGGFDISFHAGRLI